MARGLLNYDLAAVTADLLWTRGDDTEYGGWAQDANGNRTDVWSDDAVSFNLAGAVIRAIEAQVGRGRSTSRMFTTLERRVLARRDGKANPKFEWALRKAQALMAETDLEPRSALKQAATDTGIPFGVVMGAFVAWAEARMS